MQPKEEPVSTRGWTCDKCTYWNNPDRSEHTCYCCGERRKEPVSVEEAAKNFAKQSFDVMEEDIRGLNKSLLLLLLNP